MRLEYISSKTLNYPYIIGKSVVFTIGEVFESKQSIIFYADSKSIALSTANNPLFVKGTTAKIEFLYEENLLSLECNIKSFDDGILHLSMPRKAKIVQQRDDLRAECLINCSIEKLSTGKIKNLSAGGAYISLDSPIDLNLLDENSFKVNFKLKNRDVRVTCSCIENNPRFIRVKFIDMKDEIKETITQYCCNIDAELFRRNKDVR